MADPKDLMTDATGGLTGIMTMMIASSAGVAATIVDDAKETFSATWTVMVTVSSRATSGGTDPERSPDAIAIAMAF